MENLQFDNSYQNKVIVSLYTDFSFLQIIYDILNPEYFESDGRKWIVKIIKNYYKEYKNIPTMDVFSTYYNNETNELLKVNIKQKLKESWDAKDAQDLSFIKDNFREFCIHQNFKKAVYDSIDYIKASNWSAIKSSFDNALKAGQPNNIGKDLLEENVNRIFEANARITIKSPWDVINDLTDGGFGKKELYIGISSAGGGKSWTLCSIGDAALLQGKTVFHYTLELSDVMVAKRYYTIMTKIQGKDLLDSQETIINNIEKKYKPHGGKLIIKEYPTKRATVDTIGAHIDNAINNGIKPDMIIIDYGDLLKPIASVGDRRNDIGGIFEELRGIASQYEVPVVTVTQSNRCHFINDKVDIQDKGIINIGDVEVNDKILTHKGYKNILYKSNIINQPVYKIRLKSGKEIIVSADHMLPTLYKKVKSISTGLSIGDKLYTKK